MSTEVQAGAHAEARVKEFVIVVNTERVEVSDQEVSYEQVVALAFPQPPGPNTIYTVTFRKAKEPHEGSLVAGQSVEIKKEGTIFSVDATTKS